MIKLSDYIAAIEGQVLTNLCEPESVEICGGYNSDMLSDVMGSAGSGQVWITIMKHLNVIAVASMANIPAIVFAKGTSPDQAVIDKANEEELCLISSSLSSFELAGILYNLVKK